VMTERVERLDCNSSLFAIGMRGCYVEGSVCWGNKFVDNSLFYFKPVE